MPPRIHLQTERLTLREFVEADLPHVLALDSDPEVMRYISNGQPPHAEAVRRFLGNCLVGYALNPGFGFWAAIEEPDDFIGWFHFRPDREFPDEVEVGYRLKRRAWGRGLATEGACALVRNGFEAQCVNSVTGRTMRANLASIRVLEKAGLTPVAEFTEARFPGEDKAALLFRRTK
ncbi:MAG: GNAT family N-acetyltransferase [Fimbriimonadaceae bacterium]